MSVVPGICRSRGCTITMTYDVVTMRRVVQHGGNPEHVMFFDDAELMALPKPKGMTLDAVWWCHVTSTLIQWTNEIHRYQDAARRTRDGGESAGEGE